MPLRAGEGARAKGRGASGDRPISFAPDPRLAVMQGETQEGYCQASQRLRSAGARRHVMVSLSILLPM